MLPDLWSNYVFAATVGWVTADAIISLFIRGGGGATQIRLLGHLIQAKGHNYLSFLIGIVIASYLGALFSQGLKDGIELGLKMWLGASTNPEIVSAMAVLVASCLIGILVYADLHIRFYTRKNERH